MKKLTILFAISTLLLFNACNLLKIKHHQEESADFTKYKTFSFFGWTDGSGEDINEFDKKNIERSFGAEFKKRGLEYVKSNGDIVVSLFIQIDKKFSTTAYANHYANGGYGGYYGFAYNTAWGWGMGTTSYSYETQDYHKGTLYVDVFDTQSKKLIWQAVASRKLDENPKHRERNIPKVASRIMNSFPIKEVK